MNFALRWRIFPPGPVSSLLEAEYQFNLEPSEMGRIVWWEFDKSEDKKKSI